MLHNSTPVNASLYTIQYMYSYALQSLYIQMHVHVCTHVWVYVHMCACVRAYIHTYMCT